VEAVSNTSTVALRVLMFIYSLGFDPKALHETDVKHSDCHNFAWTIPSSGDGQP
jgi:hypothetical protein